MWCSVRRAMRALALLVVMVGGLFTNTTSAYAAPPPWYPPLRWYPASGQNYTAGRAGTPIAYIVIHGTAGSYAGALSWFRDPRSDLSAHYVIRARDGEVTQTVAEANTAFHARGFNRQSIGIEHEFDASAGIRYTDAQYRSSATLVCAIARRYAIPTDRAHILGHNEVPNSDHQDPGPAWDWTYYMSLVRSCSGASAASPAPGLGAGATGARVAQLQKALVSLGWLASGDVAGGEGLFGPRTRAALQAFQSASGVPSTGFYGELSAAALARALAARAVPSQDLSIGTEAPAVARLQDLLRQRGYMQVVTGYYGAVTRDAVLRFQKDHGITPTGYYGPLTRAALARDLR